MASSLDDFKILLAEFSSMSKWALAGVTALPLVTLAVDLSPPWPKGAPVATSLVELVAVVLAYHFIRSAPRKTVNKTLLWSAILLALSSLFYLSMLSAFSYTAPNGDRFLRGYECTADAVLVFKNSCPLLPLHQIAEANYAADRLWTPLSILATRLSLLVAWMIAFGSLATLLASFTSYHLRQSSNIAKRAAQP